MNAKEYLQEIQRLDVYIKQQKIEFESLKSLHTDIQAVDYSKVRVQTSRSGAGFTKASDQMLELYHEIEKDIDFFGRMRHVRIKQIQDMEKVEHMDILFKKYVEYKTIECISQEMGYSYKYTSQLHTDALKAFWKANGGEKDADSGYV